MITCGCGYAFEDSDQFCGNCGTPFPAAQIPAAQTVPPPREHSTAPFFSHAAAPPRDTLAQPSPMSNATRYLCAAAYLDPGFANNAIEHLVASHRAVVPSRGIDLIPIMRHCLKARKAQLTRDTILTGLLILSIVLAFPVLILFLIVTFSLAFLPDPQWGSKTMGKRAVAGAASVGAGAVFVIVVGLIALFALLSYMSSKLSSGGGLPIPSFLDAALYLSPVLIIAFVVVLVVYSHARFKTLGEWLRPGAQAPHFTRSSDRAETRLAEIDGAQHGNLTLYGGEDPFLGTGITPLNWHQISEKEKPGDRAWSIAIELIREGTEPGLFGKNRQGQVSIDPVELHTVLRQRLLHLNDPGLLQGQRVTQLSVDDHVVGEGHFEWTSQLVDQGRKIPYSQVSPEAIAALIRNPQARLRHYQRVSVSDEGQTVLAQQQPVIGSVDQEVVVSAFVYVAVEGHMFYLQFVPTSLAPILDYYRVIDALPKLGSAKFTARVVLSAARTSFADTLGAPYRAYRMLRTMWKESKTFREELTRSRDFVYADIGARTSIRQLGARAYPRTFIQQLDITKYTQIIERLVLDTVLDFLVDKGVDTRAYRQSAQMVYNSGIIAAQGNVQNSTVRNRQYGGPSS
jgi:uncharacterized membrane protein